jgi:hypothetical protein
LTNEPFPLAEPFWCAFIRRRLLGTPWPPRESGTQQFPQLAEDQPQRFKMRLLESEPAASRARLPLSSSLALKRLPKAPAPNTDRMSDTRSKRRPRLRPRLSPLGGVRRPAAEHGRRPDRRDLSHSGRVLRLASRRRSDPQHSRRGLFAASFLSAPRVHPQRETRTQGRPWPDQRPLPHPAPKAGPCTPRSLKRSSG